MIAVIGMKWRTLSTDYRSAASDYPFPTADSSIFIIEKLLKLTNKLLETDCDKVDDLPAVSNDVVTLLTRE